MLKSLSIPSGLKCYLPPHFSFIPCPAHCSAPPLQGAVVMEDEMDSQLDGNMLSRKPAVPLVDLR